MVKTGQNPNGTINLDWTPGLPASAALVKSLDESIESLFHGEEYQKKISAKVITYSNLILSNRQFISSKSSLKTHMNTYDTLGLGAKDTNILDSTNQAASDLSTYVSPAAEETGQQVVEVIVLMSDGRHNIQGTMSKIDNTLSIQPVINACSNFVSAAPANVRREVFTIFFRNEAADADAQKLLQECASKSTYAFQADDQAELDLAYEKITNEVIRITTTGKPQLTL